MTKAQSPSLTYVEKLTRMSKLLASCSTLTEELRRIKEVTEELAAEVSLKIDWNNFDVLVGDKRKEQERDRRLEMEQKRLPEQKSGQERETSPKMFCGHPLPWHLRYNGCIYFIMDVNKDCVTTSGNEELARAILKLSEKRKNGGI